MIRINLLPHREEKRKAKYIQFVALSVISLLLGVFVVFVVQLSIGAQIDYQESRNKYLKDETAILDKQIAEIKSLRAQTTALLARKKVVEDLQSTRSDVVHLLDQMLRILPEGVYLKSLKQAGNKIDLQGYSLSNARVSTLLRAIEGSPWLDSPNLIEIKATRAKKGTELSEFKLNFNLTKQKSESDSDSTNTAAGSKAGRKK